MEVLIGTFVLSVGLLGLAALIPIGRFAIVETGKADRGGACGRAGLREIKIQRMLDPMTWLDTGRNPIVDPTNNIDRTRNGRSFAIDPMQIARATLDGNQAAVARFPYNPSGGPSMTRVTLQSMCDPSGKPILPLARRTFTWSDELLFEMPEDANQRPRRLVRDGVGGEVKPYPRMYENERGFGDGNIPVPQHDENYSLMVTVTPAYVENQMDADAKKLYSVSVVVFWKRDYALERAERVVGAEMFGGGYGGGDVRLTGNAADLRVKEDQWLMLCGKRPGYNANGNEIPVFHWYRVVAAAEPVWNESTNESELFVTLAGPDWRPEWNINIDVDNDGNDDNAQAVLFDGDPGGVIGVYTTTVELDRDLMW